MVVLLSLCSALAYGVSDYVAGILSRRVSAWAVAAASQGVAAVVIVAAAAVNAGDLRAEGLLWGTLAGAGNGAGNVFLFRGLARGKMAVVAPLSALAAAGLPVLVAVLGGERPGVLPLAGLAAALPAIWLVSAGAEGLRGAARADLVNGLVAGAGFGVQFAALGQVPRGGGLAPLAVSQCVSVAGIAIGAAAFAAPLWPGERAGRLAAVAGVLAGAATIAFQLAAQRGLLSVASVLASLYPAVTVLLAATLLRERIAPAQGAGLALAAAAVALIAAG